MIPTLNSITSVKLSQDSAYNDMEGRDDEGSEDLSNAELYLKRSKKRGLYVETGVSNTATPTGTNVTQHLKRLLPSKPQPRRFLPRDLSPLPGRSDSKPFAWSVLDDSTPATSETDIEEANKKIQSTIKEIKNVINDFTFGNDTKTNACEDAKKKLIEEASEAIIIGNRNRESRESNVIKRRSCANVKNMLEFRKKELTLTLRTVVKEPPNNRFFYRFIHEEENTSVDTHHVKIRKRATSSHSYNSEAKRRTSSNKLPDPIQINYEDDEIKSSDNTGKSTYPYYDLNSNRESTLYLKGSESDIKRNEEVDKCHFLSSYLCEAKTSYGNLVVIKPKKECNNTSQSQISESEELEVLDIDLNATTNSSMSCTKTLMGNNFYTNNNDRSDILRKQDTNANTSDDNEVYGVYSSYNHDDTVKSISSEEIPILYDSVDTTKERGYDLDSYLLDQQNVSNNDYIIDDRYTVADEYDRRSQRHKRVHMSPKTVTPATTNYPRRNKRQRRIVKSFSSAEKRRRYIEKEKLLNLIKQQLSMDYINMEPPRSVFEELREMAKNKRRRYKRVSFSNDMENYERRFRRAQERRAEKKQRHVKRFEKNPHSIKKRNTEIDKDEEFFNKFKAMNRKVGNRKTKIMSPMFVDQKIQEIHEELSDMEDEDEVEVIEDESLQVINM